MASTAEAALIGRIEPHLSRTPRILGGRRVAELVEAGADEDRGIRRL